MIPIRDGQRNFFVEHAVVRVLWVVDDILSAKTVRVLAARVGVVPVCAGLIDLTKTVSSCRLSQVSGYRQQTYCEVIGESGARRNIALRYADRTVHVVRAILKQAMEM
nr:hypothetical protein CFP56_46624 [Quercus suber]